MDRKVVRRQGVKVATPYLRRWIKVSGQCLLPGVLGTWPHERRPRVLDLGCGNGRNSDHLLSCGFDVKSYDMSPDYYNARQTPWMAGRDSVSGKDATFDLILCQYLLMFLSDDEIYHLLLEVERVMKPGGYFLVELEKVKSGRDVKLSQVINFFLKKDHLTIRQREERGEWKVFHKVRNRCVLQYVHPPYLPTSSFTF